MNALKQRQQRRRGVAPIIATMLMIAIAVVGGILVFALFNNLSQSAGETTIVVPDSIKVLGYDARDANALRMHNGTAITVNTGSPTGKLEDGTDAVLLYFKNEGARTATISNVEIGGFTHVWDADNAGDASSISTALPGAGKFLLVSDGTVTTSSATAEVEGGDSATIVVRFDGDEDIKQGRNLITKVNTANGGQYTTVVIVGTRDT